MENASKALIIAGAILLSILIISLGIIIYRQAAGVVENNQMEELEAQTFNSKFTQYQGDSVKASVVRSLIDQVSASNATSGHSVYINYGGNEYGPMEGQNALSELSISSSKTWTVNVHYGDDGFVSYISVFREKIKEE